MTTMKPDYAKWKPPFRYDPSQRAIRNAEGAKVASSNTRAWRIPSDYSPEDCDALGQRIAELLNIDSQDVPNMPKPTAAQGACTHTKWRAITVNPPRHCIECGLLMWDAGD